MTIIIVSYKKETFRYCDVVYNIKDAKVEIVKNHS